MSEKRAAKYKLYPNKEEERNLQRTLDAGRSTVNALINLCEVYHGFGLPHPTKFDLRAMARRHRNSNPWMQEVYSAINALAADNVYNAYQKFFSDLKKGVKTGHPKFKKKEEYNTFTCPWMDTFKFIIIEGMPKYLDLGRLGTIRCRNPLIINNRISSVKVTREKEGSEYSWYAIAIYDEEMPEVQESKHENVIGVDLGLENIIATSEGECIKGNHEYAKEEKKIANLQSRMWKAEFGSPEKEKLRAKLAHMTKKRKNRKNNEYHHLSKKLVTEHDTIVMEELRIDKMRRKVEHKGTTKLYRDASWSTLTRMMKYKSQMFGTELHFVNPANTSQRCSECGNMVPKDKHERIHKCPYCGYEDDRDINGAKNILMKWINTLRKDERLEVLGHIQGFKHDQTDQNLASA